MAASFCSSTSLERWLGSTPASVRRLAANLGPIPWMYWRAKKIFLRSGTSIPAIRGTGRSSKTRQGLPCHPLALNLLVLGVRLADHPDPPLAADDLAGAAHPFD